MNEQDETIDRKRAVEDYKNAILRSVEHDEEWGKQAYSPNYDKHQMQWNMERNKQLDEKEAVAKSQYEERHGEAETGLPADAYRRQVIGERVDQQLAADSDRKDNATGSTPDRALEEKNVFRNDYWGSKGYSSADTTASAEETKVGDKGNYWDKESSPEAGKNGSNASALITDNGANQADATEQKSAEMGKSL